MTRFEMTRFLFVVFCLGITVAQAETDLQTDKKGHEGDSRYYDYGKSPSGGAAYVPMTSAEMATMNNQLNAALDAMTRKAAREDRYYENLAAKQRQGLIYGSYFELGSEHDHSEMYRLKNAATSEADRVAIRANITAAIAANKLLENFGASDYADRSNASTWASHDPVTRWKTCEVATQLARAYAFGDFIDPKDKNPEKGFAIAKAGYEEQCGGTAYWLGRIFEEGDALIPGFDKKVIEAIPKNENDPVVLQREFEKIYSIAIFNEYTPAYERMAELYRVGGPARYKKKTYKVFIGWSNGGWTKYSYWTPGTVHTEMYLMKFQYIKCLQADPANIICARGLRDVYSSTKEDSQFSYTNYDAGLAQYYTKYVKNLETTAANNKQ